MQTLDPRHSRLALKLHDLAEAIDAVEHQAALLDPSNLKCQAEGCMSRFRNHVTNLQRDLEYETHR